MAETKKVHVIRLLPTGNSPAARTERAHLQASRWVIPGVIKNEGHAGRAYSVPLDVAAALLAKGWTLCDAAGKPLDGATVEVKPEIRNGTAEWFALPRDQRPGTEEHRAAELDRRIAEAYAKEQALLAEAHGKDAHRAAPADDCPLCAGEAAATPVPQSPASQGSQEPQEPAQGAQEGSGGSTDQPLTSEPQEPPPPPPATRKAK